MFERKGPLDGCALRLLLPRRHVPHTDTKNGTVQVSPFHMDRAIVES
jgi:hypothetical protein